MGHIRRLVGYSLAVLGIGLSLFLPWWEGGGVFGDLTVTLLKVKLCGVGGCQSVDAGGAYGIVAAATAAYGAIACVAMILGGIVPALSGSTPKLWPPFASIVYLFWVMMASASLDVPDEIQAMIGLHHTPWFYAGVAGAVIGLVTPIVASFGGPKQVPFVPMALPPKPGMAKEPEPAGPMPYPGGPLRPLPVVRRGPEAIELDLPPAAETIAPGPIPSALDLLPAPEPIDVPPEEIAVSASEIVAPPEEEVSPRGGLRFALVTAHVREGGLEVRGADGRARSVPWSDVAGALARALRDAPPFPDSMFVDLVLRAGPPLRLTLDTAMTFAAGEPPAGARDGLRRVLALARAKCEHLELEPDTADFVSRRQPLPVWTLRELAAYDARYKA